MLTTSLQQSEVVGHFALELGPGHDGVEMAKEQVALSGAEVGRQGFARGLRDDPRP
jgi:hypothetical protein